MQVRTLDCITLVPLIRRRIDQVGPSHQIQVAHHLLLGLQHHLSVIWLILVSHSTCMLSVIWHPLDIPQDDLVRKRVI